MCVCVCVCLGARRRFCAHLETGYARTWRRLSTEGRRALRRRFECFFRDRSPPRVPNYTFSWYSYYRAVIARRECPEPLAGAFGRLDSDLKSEKIRVASLSRYWTNFVSSFFPFPLCRTATGALSVDRALLYLQRRPRFPPFAVSYWDFIDGFVVLRGGRSLQRYSADSSPCSCTSSPIPYTQSRCVWVG